MESAHEDDPMWRREKASEDRIRSTQRRPRVYVDVRTGTGLIVGSRRVPHFRAGAAGCRYRKRRCLRDLDGREKLVWRAADQLDA